MSIRQAMETVKVLQAASPETLAALIPYGMVEYLKKSRHLFMDKDEMKYVYFLISGAVVLYKLSDRQDKKAIFICGPGELLNEEFLDGRAASVYCEALSDSKVLCLERHKFLQVCGMDAELMKAVMNSMALKIRKLYRQIRNTANTVRGDRKIAAKLWKLSQDYGSPCNGGVRIDFEISVTFLADLLGSKRETVSRQLKMLTQMGLVAVDKNHFVIPSRDALKRYFYEA